MGQEPIFLSLEHVEAIHARSLLERGGAVGTRDAGGLESAVLQPRNVFYYVDRDFFEIAAAYAFHIAEAQAYLTPSIDRLTLNRKEYSVKMFWAHGVPEKPSSRIGRSSSCKITVDDDLKKVERAVMVVSTWPGAAFDQGSQFVA